MPNNNGWDNNTPGGQYANSFRNKIAGVDRQIEELNKQFRGGYDLPGFQRPHINALAEAAAASGVGAAGGAVAGAAFGGVGAAPGAAVGATTLGLGTLVERGDQEIHFDPLRGMGKEVTDITAGKTIRLFGNEVWMPWANREQTLRDVASKIADRNKMDTTSRAEFISGVVNNGQGTIDAIGKVASDVRSQMLRGKSQALAQKKLRLEEQADSPQTVQAALAMNDAEENRKMRAQEIAMRADELAWRKADAERDRLWRSQEAQNARDGQMLAAMISALS